MGTIDGGGEEIMQSNPQKLARQLLHHQDYDEAIELLQQALEENDEQLTLYWDLGLVHLWHNQPDEAEATWLTGITKGWELGIEESLEQLVSYLLTELEDQARQENHDQVWLLRGQLQSLNPEDWDNTLKLIQLSHRLDRFEIEQLLEWNIVERLEVFEVQDEDDINAELLLDCLLIILNNPTELSLDFFSASIAKLAKINWLNDIMALSLTMATDKSYPNYARSIASICLKHHPGNLYIIHQLMGYCEIEDNKQERVKYARLLYDWCCDNNNNISRNCFIYSRVLFALMKQGYWQEIEEKKLFDKLSSELEQLIKNDLRELDSFVAQLFWAIPAPFLYFHDAPATYRPFFNKTAELFQENHLKYCGQKESFSHFLNANKERRPVKIGYIGHTLRKHSVGWLSRWLFHYHDKKKFQLYFYLVDQENDQLTEEWILSNAHKVKNHSRDVVTIAEDIYNDDLDLLVDLDGLTNKTVAQVLALKPAPIQLTWLGSDASGLPAIDYFLVDDIVLPPKNQACYREKLWYLPRTYIAVDGFEVGSPTLTRSNLGIDEDAVIYFNVQYSAKCNPAILRLQLEILQAVPKSVLLLKGGSDNQSISEDTTSLAIEMGIEQDRVIFLPRDPDEATHRANLAIADVVLDTYPYGGATTTLETLWMGIPLVTWVGEQFSARNSYAFMRQVGLTAGIAHSAEEYRQWGIRLGRNPQLRQEIRQTLRSARKSSPLWQAEAFTRDMEDAYQAMIEKKFTGDDR